MRIGVVGGGIGGLTAAIALSTAHEVTVIERAPSFEPVGAGLVLAANATAVLASLGVDLRPIGRQLELTQVRRADGGLLQSLDVSSTVGTFGPTLALSRPALHEALTAALPDSVAVRLDAPVTGLSVGERPVVRNASGIEDHFDLVVGADGIHSTIREDLPLRVELRYSGVTSWRGIVPSWGVETAVEYWGNQLRIGLVPLPGDSLYYFLVASTPPDQPGPSSAAELADLFREFDPDARRLFDELSWPPPHHHDLWELDHPVWGEGRVLLLGDAAHAMTPNLGQGAAMAIEDAIALERALRPGIDGALDRYRSPRDRRVRRVQVLSRRLGALAHTEGEGKQRLRNLLMRAIPPSMSKRQHAKLVKPGLDLLDPAS